MAELPYLGEPVDQRAHALQAAGHARRGGADPELFVATLLHDVARVPEVRVPGQPHEKTGAEWCLPRFGPRVAWLVGAHVAAKRFLVATSSGYALSEASIASLRRQGGPMAEEEKASFAAHPWAEAAIQLRQWDDAAKVPGATEIEIDDVLAKVRSVAGEH